MIALPLFHDVATVPALDMPARSLSQPYAGLVALGLKTIETRKTRTNIRGPFVVCSTLTPDCAAWDRLRDRIPAWAMPYCYIYGYALGLVDITGCRPLVPADEPQSWFYAPNRWAWLLANPRTLTPFQVRGFQGWFRVPRADVARALDEGGDRGR